MIQSDDLQERDRPLSPDLIVQEIVEETLDPLPDAKDDTNDIESGTDGPQNPENAVENFAIWDTWAPGGSRGREDVFNQVPLGIGNVHGLKRTREDEAISVEITAFWSFEIASNPVDLKQ